MRWFAGSIYAGMVAFVWINGGVSIALLVLACVLFLTATMRVDLMGEWASGWAEWIARRRRTRPPASTSGR
jgi:hypothetical protein